jgi:rhodanese-related sulfurtransferase
MKKIIAYSTVFFIAITLLSSFKKNEQILQSEPTEFEILVQYLEANGNFINSDLAPAIISASEIKDNLKNDKYLVLDLRSEAWFEYGHIKNSVNVNGPDLLTYFENEIDPATFDKITIVCYSGQSAAYYTGLLRLAGYNNVYNLKWGMSSWDEELATNMWIKNTTDDLTAELETTENPMPEKGSYPTLATGKTDAEEILKQRITEAFAKPYKEFIVKTPDAIANPSDYYIVNYMSEEKYNAGHLKGAVQYTPNQSLATTADLATLPTDKKILINCETGQAAAYAVAYLQILGYDVYNLAYGNNSYMNKVLKEKGWNAFSSEEIKNYPIVE